jgi:hypothetical protein
MRRAISIDQMHSQSDAEPRLDWFTHGSSRYFQLPMCLEVSDNQRGEIWEPAGLEKAEIHALERA